MVSLVSRATRGLTLSRRKNKHLRLINALTSVPVVHMCYEIRTAVKVWPVGSISQCITSRLIQQIQSIILRRCRGGYLFWGLWSWLRQPIFGRLKNVTQEPLFVTGEYSIKYRYVAFPLNQQETGCHIFLLVDFRECVVYPLTRIIWLSYEVQV